MDYDQIFVLAVMGSIAGLGGVVGWALRFLKDRETIRGLLERIEREAQDYHFIEQRYHEAVRAHAEALQSRPVDTAATGAALTEALETFPPETLGVSGSEKIAGQATTFLERNGSYGKFEEGRKEPLGIRWMSDEDLARAYAVDWLVNSQKDMNELATEFTRRGLYVPTRDQAEGYLPAAMLANANAREKERTRGAEDNQALDEKRQARRRVKKDRQPIDHSKKLD